MKLPPSQATLMEDVMRARLMIESGAPKSEVTVMLSAAISLSVIAEVMLRAATDGDPTVLDVFDRGRPL